MMGQVSAKLWRTESGYSYWCQGCEETHTVRTDGAGRANWSFDGNLAAPTFSPSVLVTSGHYMAEHPPGERCWCDYNREHPGDEDGFHCFRCHTFVVGGMVQFLADCSHALAGQTLPLPDLPAHLIDENQP